MKDCPCGLLKCFYWKFTLGEIHNLSIILWHLCGLVKCYPHLKSFLRIIKSAPTPGNSWLDFCSVFLLFLNVLDSMLLSIILLDVLKFTVLVSCWSIKSLYHYSKIHTLKDIWVVRNYWRWWIKPLSTFVQVFVCVCFHFCWVKKCKLAGLYGESINLPDFSILHPTHNVWPLQLFHFFSLHLVFFIFLNWDIIDRCQLVYNSGVQ